MAERKSSSKSSEKSDSPRKKSAGQGRKNSAPRKRPVQKKRASSSRRKSKKVVLDKAKVSLFAGVVFLLCCILLSVNILMTPPKKSDAVQVESNKSGTAAENPSEKKEKPVQSEKNVAKTENSSSSEKKSSSVDTKTKESSSSEKKEKSSVAVTPSSTQKTPAKEKSVPAVPANSSPSARSESAQKTDSSTAVTMPKEDSSPFDIPPAKNGASIVIIIDDAGLNYENCRKYAELPFPLTIAVLPKLPNTKKCADLVASSGKELILHQPMQSINKNLDPGPGKITSEMGILEIQSIVRENLLELGPFVKGLNNHEGSDVTSNIIKIGAVLDVCAEKNIYFLDSRTTSLTKAPEAALERDIPIFEKSGPYIDNVISRDAMLSELYKSIDIANKNGTTIIIGHVDKSVNILPALLREMYPYMKEAGYKFKTPSML